MIFSKPPADYNKQIDVVGCFILHEGKFLLLQRQSHKKHGNKWGLPAGKLDPGETLVIAAQRELAEETGIFIPLQNLRQSEVLYVRDNGFDIDWHMFSTETLSQPDVTINPEEHQGFCWASPETALEMDLIHDMDQCIRIFFDLKSS